VRTPAGKGRSASTNASTRIGGRVRRRDSSKASSQLFESGNRRGRWRGRRCLRKNGLKRARTEINALKRHYHDMQREFRPEISSTGERLEIKQSETVDNRFLGVHGVTSVQKNRPCRKESRIRCQHPVVAEENDDLLASLDRRGGKGDLIGRTICGEGGTAAS